MSLGGIKYPGRKSLAKKCLPWMKSTTMNPAIHYLSTLPNYCLGHNQKILASWILVFQMTVTSSSSVTARLVKLIVESVPKKARKVHNQVSGYQVNPTIFIVVVIQI
uniref:Uncharacterized protein n=1 Tax=Cacopsylla melanoneura TaxID=428564 RepID=A0A8D8Y499_9HEMI